ncbi:glycine receptor subunit alpha-2-like [Amphiura filiformis]|uniref:glycine receptor subunit alpha-2-like n=1 Tax=Amphiura filiformis TaxID=82378 RepID=UPI003B21B6CB
MPQYRLMPCKGYSHAIHTGCKGAIAAIGVPGIRKMTCCVFILLFFVHQSGSDSEEEGAEHGNEHGEKQAKANCPYQNKTCHHMDGLILREMLNNYGDGSVRPGAPVHQADTVHCYLNVMSFHSVADLTMDYTISFTLHSSWYDLRLAQNETESLVIRGTNIDRIWRPDLYFPLEKSHELHFVMGDDRVVRLLPNGEVWFSTKLTLTQACPMDFKTFPFDVQKCNLEIGSLGHFSNELQIQWGKAKHTPVEVHHVEDLSHFWLEVANLTSFNSSNWGQMHPLPYIRVTFVLTRRLEFHLLFYFFPTALLVLISWTNFFLDVQAVPARVALGITTILTMFTQIMTTRGSLPRVSYVTALDVWLFACLSFVILASFEYVLAHYVSTRPKRSKTPVRKSGGINSNDEEDELESDQELHRTLTSSTNRVYAQTHVNMGRSSKDIPYITNTNNNHKKRKRRKTSILEALCSLDCRIGNKSHKSNNSKKDEPKRPTNAIDIAARIVFPLSFTGFTMIFFYFYCWPLEETLRHVGHYKGKSL